MSSFQIKIKAGNPAVFDPTPLTAKVNDSVSWYNGDLTKAHWPAPSVANPKGLVTGTGQRVKPNPLPAR